MLALSFNIGKDRFALRCAEVVEVVPRVHLRDIPHAPAFIAGTFTYRGQVVPVIDLGLLLWNASCADRMSTRIILVRYPPPPAAPKMIGLLAERVTEAITLDTERAAPPGIAIADAPYLGDVFFEERGSIQVLRLDAIFQGPARAMLFEGGAP